MTNNTVVSLSSPDARGSRRFAGRPHKLLHRAARGDNLASNPPGVIGGEERDDIGDVFRLADSAQRSVLNNGLQRLGREEFLEWPASCDSRLHGVDRNTT